LNNGTTTVIRAKNFREVILKTLNIDKGKIISKLPFCELLYRGKIEGKLTCGMPKLGISYDCGFFGMCILHKPTSPKSYCPLSDFFLLDSDFPGNIPKEYKKKKIIVRKVRYNIIDLSIK
jgi:hypothetical protein